ncbi:MAG: AAA family ATPase [Actinomycetota bacterium]
MGPVTLDAELAALARAREAVADKLERVERLVGTDGGADAVSQEYVDAIIGDTIELLQRDLVVFGRVDDDRTWRIGLYGIDSDGDQLVVDWRAPFATGFYQATVDDDHGLRRRVSYVGSIDDLLVEDLVTGEASGSSPLLAELSRTKGEQMRAAVATLQSDQDSLVRLDPDDRLVLRGGPGTGKTVVGLHRAAWLVYNDRRITSDRILVVGPSDRFLRYVASVLPTLGERKIRQTTFTELLGPDTPAGGHAEWVEVLDRFEASLVEPAEIKVRGRRITADQIAEIADRISASRSPWSQRRRLIIDRTAALRKLPRAEVAAAMAKIVPTCSTTQALKRLRNPDLLARLGAGDDLQRDWLAVPEDGGVTDEVRARIEGVPARYSHAIVDEAQDLTALQLRAVRRRAPGLTLVGDDAQRSHAHGIGLRAAARALDVDVAEMTTAYRQSAEIVEWLNELAAAHPELDAVEMLGIRPTGTPVREVAELGTVGDALHERWDTVTTITAADTWRHQGIEYDAVVVERAGMSPRELYLAASRAAHELVVVG